MMMAPLKPAQHVITSAKHVLQHQQTATHVVIIEAYPLHVHALLNSMIMGLHNLVWPATTSVKPAPRVPPTA